ncbi:hypothetical protein RCH16_002290 [Cryobacterium sp. MP_M5]|uniref:VanZ family protein n=1 Tax=unclassified Cryobacterium TaxID=2649013 RepID=UPI0018CA721D|nr:MULTISPECIES: VanZ family protein [unclassified Cryobacterium]MBG6058641.1 hypothetical protein [Cryobacterium sp. MP_M3]MEC5177279.1 hypothetical protein [Cryobacterium sp. MP_M5]
MAGTTTQRRPSGSAGPERGDARLPADVGRPPLRRWLREPQLRRLTLRLAGAYVLALALVALWPTPVDHSGHDSLLAGLDWLQAHGGPVWLRYSLVEFTANILLFIPAGLFLVVLAGARRWWLGVLTGFTVSAALELGQLVFLPDRVASVNDILANTSGAVIGAVIAVALLPPAARAAAPLP